MHTHFYTAAHSCYTGLTVTIHLQIQLVHMHNYADCTVVAAWQLLVTRGRLPCLLLLLVSVRAMGVPAWRQRPPSPCLSGSASCAVGCVVCCSLVPLLVQQHMAALPSPAVVPAGSAGQLLIGCWCHVTCGRWVCQLSGSVPHPLAYAAAGG